ncbi:MAG TPA: SpoIIE family protein phosphatase [Candidatus Competibacteraceae bacterium]|nr:SpoIIE family protein phosphatase [Candidatus Competibacteraceae bacterium]
MTATVLLIDDERDVRESLAAFLEDCDFQVLEAASGEQGIAICRETRPDLVLCDLRMPGMDGLAVLEVIRHELPETPFLVLSGLGRLREAVDALKRGAWDYLTKPIEDLEMLEHAINQALERARLLRKNREYQEHLEETNRRLQRSLQQLEEDEAAGRRIQFQLLPEDDFRHQGYHFRRRLLTSMYLSGDFVDYFVLDAEHISFYIADVSGHGVSSAFVTVLLKSYMSRYLELFRQGKSRGLMDPAKILTRLNRNILKGNMGKYLTMFYGIINTARRELTFSNGGQFPPPILYDDREARFIGTKNVPVGLFDFAEYQNDTLELPERFTLTLISDGILETLGEPSLADKQARLLERVGQSGLTLETLLTRLDLDDEQRQLPDDITLLLIDNVS